MNEEMESKIRASYERIFSIPNRVVDIFNHFFGEDKVDFEWTYEYYSLFLRTVHFNDLFDIEDAKEFYPNYEQLHNEAESSKMLDHPITEIPEYFDLFFPIVEKVIKSRDYTIQVYFPKVRVTNEDDEYIDITKLFVKVNISSKGTIIGTFTMNRSEYTKSQFLRGYLHSHVSGIPKGDYSHFNSPCLGTGPIKATISSLASDFDENMWHLFCLELSKYVRVESKAGRPYIYLTSVGNVNYDRKGHTFNMIHRSKTNAVPVLANPIIKDFIKYLITHNKLEFNFSNGSFGFAMSYIDFRIYLSNEFIKWYNTYTSHSKSLEFFIENKVLEECRIFDGAIYSSGIDRSTVARGKYVTRFKGEDIYLNIIDDNRVREGALLFTDKLTYNIANGILAALNYFYTDKYEILEYGEGNETDGNKAFISAI